MSRPQGRLRVPPGGLRGFSPASTTGAAAAPGKAKGGFGGFEAAQSKSGLAYISGRADLSAISDAHAVVSFKQLEKKDSTTRERALEDLAAFVQAHPYESDGGTEDGVLDAWTQCYPRLSIDDSRKVRELAHTLQFALMKSARKRMERRIPKIVGPWLAGTYDRDRPVAKAAADGLTSFLTSDEKKVLFWKRLQPQILQYATAASQETPTTLSDIRSSTKEDADLKYYRVLYSSLSLVLALLRMLSVADTQASNSDYEQFFAAEAIWSCAVSTESYLRSAAYELFLQCLDTRPELLALQQSRLTKLLVQDASRIRQSGSIIQYLKVLQKLSDIYPDTWSEGGHPFTRLRPLVEKGSQGTRVTSSVSFWSQLDALFSSMPTRSISSDEASEILAAFRSGLSSRDEPQSNAVEGWTAYLSMTKRIIDSVTPETARKSIVEASVHPILDHYLSPPAFSKTANVWVSSSHLPILTRASLLISRPAYPDIVDSARAAWTRLSSNLAGRMANSLPEVSKDFKTSQEHIANEGDRWFSLVADIHRSVEQVEAKSQAGGQPTNLVEEVLEQPTVALLQSAIDLLEKRNYKPFGAAQLVSAAFTRTPHLFGSDSGKAIVSSLFPVDRHEQLSLILSSPSTSPLLSCLRSMASIPELRGPYEYTYASIISLLLANKNTDTGATARNIAYLISDASDAALATNRRNEDLQTYLVDACLATAQGQASGNWDLFRAVFGSNVLNPDNGKALATDIIGAIDSGDATNSSGLLTALEIIADRAPELLAGNESLHVELIAKLLSLMEVRDNRELSAKALALRTLLDRNTSHSSRSNNAEGSGVSPLLKIIQDNIDNAGPDSLEISTLVEQAVGIATSSTATAEDKENLFPNTHVWMESLQTFMQGGLDPALSLTSSLGGAYLLVPPGGSKSVVAVTRDRHGSCTAARIAAYTTELLESVDSLSISALPQEFQVELLYSLYLVAELGSDQIALGATDSLWGDLSSPSAYESSWALSTAEEQVTAIRSLLVAVAETQSPATTQALVEIMLAQTRQLTPLGVYSARALSSLLQTREGDGVPTEDDLVKLNLWKASPETALGASAFLCGYGELLQTSKTVSNFCNRLISDVAGASPAAKPQATLATLVLLDACLAVYAVGELPTATNRLVFAVKQITSWFVGEQDDEEEGAEKKEAGLDTRIATESCRVLMRLLPCIKDIYGPHWERTIRFCIGLWGRALSSPSASSYSPLPYIYASLKLSGAIEAIDEPNDDLEDALALFADAKWAALRQLLLARAHFKSGATRSQPHIVVDNLLARMASKTPLSKLTNLAPLYTLVTSDSRDIQTVGFNFLHRALPTQQEEYSLNVILEKKVGRLPDQLLALLEDAPTLEAYPDEVLATFPMPVRSYLLGWKLVFDAFSTASAKIRSDYADHLSKTAGDLVPALLNFTFDVLGHSAAHALDLDHEGLSGASNIVEYDLAAANDGDPDERHLNRLLVHLYYLTLKYLPGLFRGWYAACRSKQTTVAVDAWTAKYVSAILIDEVLDDVEKWGEAQEAEGGGGDDDRELLLKVGKKSREVVAGYEVDELTMSIALRLPANYPIDNVSVIGLNRVAVDEKKWQSWLMITQGVIAFSNGSLVEGLATFRRNVLGALKGQTECAICYSIISADKKMPDKRCSTCRNLFHRSCLYKWFQSSNQNSCPLCRNPISFLGSDTKQRRAHPDDGF